MAESIKTDGLAQPLAVKMNDKPPHWIIAGERRWKACEGILHTIPVHILEIDEEAAIRMNLIENVQRDDLTAIEEAFGLDRLIKTSKRTQGQVGEEVGKTQAWVSNRLRLLRLTEDLQTLYEKGAFSASQARDLILPFSKLPERLWDVLANSVASTIARRFKKKAEILKDEDLRMLVSKVATNMSGWLDRPEWNADTQELFGHHLRIPKEKWKTAPAGSVVSYLFGTYPNEPSSRAFDMDWWQLEMNAAKAVYDEDLRRRNEEKMDEVGGEGRDLEWSPVMGVIPEAIEIPPQQLHIVYAPLQGDGKDLQWQVGDNLSSKDGLGHRTGNLHADPTVIPDECLVIVDGPGGPGFRDQPMVLCTKADVFEAAEASLGQKFDKMVERTTARAIAHDVRESAGIKLSEGFSTLLVAGTLLPENPNILPSAIETLGIGTPFDEEEECLNSWNAWTLALHTYLLELPKKDSDRLLKLLVYRLVQNPDGSQMDPSVSTRDKVAVELRGKLVKELGGKIELPVWKKEAPAKADTPEPEGEEA